MIEQIYDFAVVHGFETFITNYWVLIFIEFPRFVVASLIVISQILYSKNRDFNIPDLLKRGAMQAQRGITIAVPVHNDGENIARTILSIREQTVQKIEIILINDGSTDNTHEVCKVLKNKGLVDHYVHIQSRGGKAAAVNVGLSMAKYPYFVMIDSDTTFDRDALQLALPYFDDPSVGYVAGNLGVRNYKNSISTRLQQINYLISITLGRTTSDMVGSFFIASGAYGLYRTEVARSIGGFENVTSEDGDMSVRMRLAGWKIRFATFSTATTVVPEDPVSLGYQRLRWDRGFVAFFYRKFFKAVMNPLNKNFDLRLAIGVFDLYVFSTFVPFIFLGYYFWLFHLYGVMAYQFAVVIILFYAVVDLAYIGFMYTILPKEKRDPMLFLYAPIYGFINSHILRAITGYSIINEMIFRKAEQDPYVPMKVRKRRDRI